MALPAHALEKSRPKRIHYPTSDGKPMGETDKHVDLILDGKAALMIHFADRPDVYVAGNNFIYYEEGNPKARVSPDLYVVHGVPMRQRDSYCTWQESGRCPNVVFEFTSRATRREDTHKKFTLYEQTLRVPEYVMFDPTRDYLKPPLKGFRLTNGVYVPIPLIDDRLYSEQLNLYITYEGTRLRFYDPQKREWLLTPLENARRAEEEARRAKAAEAEVARLRAELEALRKQR